MDSSDYLQFLLALIFVLGLIFTLAWAARRFNFGGLTPTGSNKRLVIVEARPIDARHRLVLVRRDDVEHLLVLGPEGAAVIERDIKTPGEPPSVDGDGHHVSTTSGPRS
jgi:flagellar protein FliO/FliZ